MSDYLVDEEEESDDPELDMPECLACHHRHYRHKVCHRCDCDRRAYHEELAERRKRWIHEYALEHPELVTLPVPKPEGEE